MLTNCLRLLSVLIFLNSVAFSETYYIATDGVVTPTAAQAWSNATNIATPTTLANANTYADDDDIVILRGGVYSTAIAPANSGSQGHVIEYRSYSGEEPIITVVSSSAIFLDGKDYIKINGITVSGSNQLGNIRNGSDYNEITNCKFTAGDGSSYALYVWGQCPGGSPYNCPSTNNWIHNNTFYEIGQVVSCNDEWSPIYIGSPTISILVTNQGFETDANWSSVGTPTTNERSTTLVIYNSYNRKVVVDAAGEGIRSDSFTTKSGHWHRIKVMVYPINATSLRIVVRNGANDADAYDTTHTGLTANAWNRIMTSYYEEPSKGGAGAYLSLLSPVGETDATYYFDHGTGADDSVVGYGDSDSNNNTIENNTMYSGGHHLLETYTKFNIIRDNYFHNECWMDASACTYARCANNKYGNRNIQIYDYFANDGVYNLIEKNRFGHAGRPPDDDGGDGLTITAPKNIIRYNSIFNSAHGGIYFKSGIGSYSNNNRVYNNTVYGNGINESTGYLFRYGMVFTAVSGNVIKNNLLYNNYSGDFSARGSGSNLANQTFTQNWLNSDVDPLFVNTDVSDPTNAELPDLSLQPTSDAINGGTHLTTVHADDTGIGITLKVEDALYFQDGTWGSSLAGHTADWIAVGTVSNVVQISAINYSTNTITLANSITRNDGDPVWLYKKSDGEQVLYGSAPDYGAYEYVSSVTSIPAGVHIGGGIEIK